MDAVLRGGLNGRVAGEIVSEEVVVGSDQQRIGAGKRALMPSPLSQRKLLVASRDLTCRVERRAVDAD